MTCIYKNCVKKKVLIKCMLKSVIKYCVIKKQCNKKNNIVKICVIKKFAIIMGTKKKYIYI